MIRSVVAVDPGKSTGVAYYRIASDMRSAPSLQTETIEDWREVPHRVFRFWPDLVHVEEFRVNASTASKTAAPWSLKCYGALEARAFECEVKFSHAPSTVKSTVTNRHLKDAGLWDGRTAHERDALRHLVLVLAKMNDPWARGVLTRRTQ